MRFAVPQFIDVEDKLFGPLTLKQAIYLTGAAGVVLAVFSRFGFFLAILVAIPVGILAFALAFAKINNRPFVFMVYSATFYAVKHKLYLWKKVAKKKAASTQQTAGAEGADRPLAPKMSQSRLKELAWSLDTKESMYEDESQWKQ